MPRVERMPTFIGGDTAIHYEVHGSGFPVLVFAPGGMRSSIPLWARVPFDPFRELAEFRVIAVDQRNAGGSRAAIDAADGWHSYAADHLALLDDLGIRRCHLLGCCIGGSFCLRLAKEAPARLSAAVLLQPIGLGEGNRDLFLRLYDDWAAELVHTRPDVTANALAGLKSNLFGGEFVFSVSRDDVRGCPVPLLVLRGNDPYHPPEISEEIARIAPRAELVASWTEGDDVGRAAAKIRAFLGSVS